MSDDNSSSTIELNRRRVLGALGTIGVASAGAGAGTFALFSDTESSSGNSVQAGTLNLTADGNDGAATTTLDVTGAAPGESGTETTTLRNTGNIDGYLNVTVDAVSSAENGLSEPERDAGDSSTGSNSGELAEYVNLNLGFADDFGAGNVLAMENVQFNPNTLLGDGPKDLEVEWEIDEDAGNVIQSDSVTIDFTIELVQEPQDSDVVLTGDTIYGEGAGFSDPWTTTTEYAHSGAGAWGVESSDTSKYGFYFAGDFSANDALPTYTVEEIQDISYWLYESNALDQSDIYLNIYTRPENDGNDSASWYDSRLQALPQEANRGSPNFTPGEWNEFTTKTGASNTLTWADTAREGKDFTQDLPTLNQVQNGTLDWSNWGAGQSFSHDYRDEEVMALSLQAGSGETVEAYIDDITVELTSGETVTYDLEP